MADARATSPPVSLGKLRRAWHDPVDAGPTGTGSSHIDEWALASGPGLGVLSCWRAHMGLQPRPLAVLHACKKACMAEHFATRCGSWRVARAHLGLRSVARAACHPTSGISCSMRSVRAMHAHGAS